MQPSTTKRPPSSSIVRRKTKSHQECADCTEGLEQLLPRLELRQLLQQRPVLIGLGAPTAPLLLLHDVLLMTSA